MNPKTALLTLMTVCAAMADHEPGHEGPAPVRVGSLTHYQHGVYGELHAINESTLMLTNFEYDGAAPDPFFLVGTTDKPQPGGTILPYPFQGKFYDFEDTSAPIISGRFDKANVTLTLPEHLKVSDLRWFSVWCRAFKVNFADIFFAEDVFGTGDHRSASSSTSSPASAAQPGELPPPSQPKHADGKYNHDDHDSSHAEPESEAEAEARPSHGAAGALVPSALAALLAVFVRAL